MAGPLDCEAKHLTAILSKSIWGEDFQLRPRRWTVLKRTISNIMSRRLTLRSARNMWFSRSIVDKRNIRIEQFRILDFVLSLNLIRETK